MIIRSLFLFISMFATTFLNAQNADLSGNWVVKGENPKGESYEGKVSIEKLNRVLYKLDWEVAYEGKSKYSFPGTGLYDKKSNVMFAAYGVETYRYGLIQYPLNDKGGLEGNATWTSHKGVGTELLAGELNKKEIKGIYSIVGRRSKGDIDLGTSETYSGTLKIYKKKDDLYTLEWYLGDGQPYQGFAFKQNDQLIGVWGVGDSFGLEIYKFEADGKMAKSEWMSPLYEYKKGIETIVLK